jgi:signal peptidase I
MSSSAPIADSVTQSASRWRLHLPTVPEAFASFLRTVVVALFLLTFLLQPFLIPSESMEHTLLVGDFLLVNKQVFAPSGTPGRLLRWLLPYRDVERGDIVVFHHPDPPYLVKRVVGIPGDQIRIEDGRVTVNGRRSMNPTQLSSLQRRISFGITSPPALTPTRTSIRSGGGGCRR